MSSIAPPPSQGWSSFFSLIPATTGSTSDIGPGVQTAIPQTPAPSIEDFATWDRLSQTVYATLYSSASLTSTPAGQPSVNYAIRLGPDGLPQSRLASSNSAADWKTLPAGTTAKVASPSNLPADTFRGWTTLGQQAYLKAANVDQNVGLRESDGSYSRYQLNQYGHIIKTPLGQLGQGLEPTPGMRIDFNRDGEVDIPYYHLPGSSDGNSGALISQGAAYLFPALDGYNRSLKGDKPEGFDTTPASIGTDKTMAEAFLKQFSTWHSSFQTEWVKKYTTDAQPTAKSLIEMPSGAQVPIVSLFVTNQDPRTVVNVATVTKESIARLSRDDQTTLLTSRLFTNGKAADLGLSISTWNPDSVASLQLLNTNPDAEKIATDFNAFYALVEPHLPVDPVSTTNPPFDARAFRDELDILQKKIISSTTIDTKYISKELLDLRQRFDRAQNYYDVAYGSSKQTTMFIGMKHSTFTEANNYKLVELPNGVVSQDDGATIQQGYRTFIAQERRLAENAQKRYDAATNTITGIDGKPFDLPTLIYYLQDLYNTDLEAMVTIETEAVRQTNAYLKDYADWQDMVNTTLSKWGKDDKDDKGLFGGSNGDGNTFLAQYKVNPTTPEEVKANRQIKLALMFDASYVQFRHPIERPVTGEVDKVTRPDNFHVFKKEDNLNNNYDYNLYQRDVWQTYGTRLGEKVTQLNQDSQQKMNDINNLDKQRNRHYDLANSALSKMNDALQAILRATG